MRFAQMRKRSSSRRPACFLAQPILHPSFNLSDSAFLPTGTFLTRPTTFFSHTLTHLIILVYKSSMEQNSPIILTHKLDAYNSAKVYAKDVPETEQEFAASLPSTMEFFQQKEILNVAIFLYLKHSDYIKHLVK